MYGQSPMVKRLLAWLHARYLSWLLFWRKPLIRFSLFSVITLLILGRIFWLIARALYPNQTESASLADRITPQTKLEQLLAAPTMTPPQLEESTQQWISCSDIRRVLTDTDRVYIGCRGGVLITNLQGQILQQFSQADGLTNDIVTDLLVVNKKIFVGSQDGVSVIDTTTGKVAPLRVKEGLVNGSNITLAADGNDVWVGTFDGVSRIASDTLAITNYRTELADATDIYSVHRIFVTPKAVYFSLISSAHTQGGLARFDKATQTFAKIPASQFFRSKDPLKITSINYLNISAVGDQLVLQDGDIFWLAQDRPQMNITRLPNITETLSQLAQTPQVSGVELLGTINSQVAIRFWAGDGERLAVLTPKSKEVRLVAPQDPAFPLVRAYSLARPTVETAMPTIQANRPFAFGRLLAAIGDEAWLTAQDGVWTLNVKTGNFQRRLPWPDEVGVPDQVWLVPLVGTSQVILGRQVCGMGCIEPDFWKIELQDYTAIKLQIPDDIRQYFQNSGGEIGALDYLLVQPPTWNDDSNQVVFQLPRAQLSVDVIQNQWKVDQDSVGTSTEPPRTIQCHQQYFLNRDTNELKIERDQCPNQLGVLRLGDYAFKVQEGVAAADDWLSDGTGKKIATVAASEPIYSPFPGWTDPVRVASQVVDRDAIWLIHNRGVTRYEPKKDVWQVFTSKTGLPGPIATDGMLLGDRLVVLTRGGLAVIPINRATSETP